VKTKKLLIAGGGYADIPLIQAGHELGYYVITSGNKPNEMGHKYSDEYHLMDYSDKEGIWQLAGKLQVDAICPCCNDFSAISCAYVASKLGLPGHDTYETSLTIHHKDRFRAFASKHSVPSPRSVGFTQENQSVERIKALRFPLLVKPVDLSGGKGISKIFHFDQAARAIRKALARSKAKRVVVEEFIEGTRHGFSTFLYNRKVVFYFSDNEHYFKNPYLVSAASAPAIVPSDVEKNLCAESERIASLLRLTNGIFHIQYILRDRKPYITEICRRPPGDLYIKLVEYATGVNYSLFAVKAAAGLDCGDLSQKSPKGFFTRHCIMSEKEGRVKDIVFDPYITSQIIDKMMWGKPGDIVTDAMTAKFGIVFLQFGSMDEMFEKTERMQDLIHVVME